MALNPVTIRYTRISKNVSSITFGLQRPFTPRFGFQSNRPLMRLFTDSSKQHQEKHKEDQERKQLVGILKGDLGLSDKTRNATYLLSAIGLAVCVILGIWGFLNSETFAKKLQFDESKPEEWPVTFMELSAIVVQLDRFSMPEEYYKRLIRGTVHPVEEIRKTCASALASLTTDRILCGQIAKDIDLKLMLQYLQNSETVDLLTSTVDLMEGLSQLRVNAPIILNKDTMRVFEGLCNHSKPEVLVRVSKMVNNLTRSDEVDDILIRLLPPLSNLYNNVDEDGKRDITLALKNIIVTKGAKEKNANLFKLAMARAEFPEAELEKIKSFSERSATVNAIQSVGAAMFFASLWGSARWGIHGYGRGLRGADLLNLMKSKTPRTMLGAAGVYLAFSIDDKLYYKVFEPNFTSETKILGTFAFSSFTTLGFIWLSQGLAPFSFVPAVIYPMYRFYKEGDSRYFED